MSVDWNEIYSEIEKRRHNDELRKDAETFVFDIKTVKPNNNSFQIEKNELNNKIAFLELNSTKNLKIIDLNPYE